MGSESMIRDSGPMHTFVKEWDEFSSKISKIARNLESCCSEARSVLQDEYSGKLIAQIEDFTEVLTNTVKQGEAPVRELERSAKTLDELEELR